MNGKPVLYRENTRTVLTDPANEFAKKLLCDGLVLNLGDACAFHCTFCYCEAAMWKIDKPIVDEYNRQARLFNPVHVDLGYQDVVIRRRGALSVLAGQLVRADGSARYSNPDDHRVLYSSTLVDVAGNMELLRETAAACNLILENTGWQIRLLSKSSLLPKLVELIPEKHHQRLIFGFSTGTLDERICQAIELGTARVSQRIKALHWLQDHGFRTFGMLCPTLPQEDYATFSRSACEAIRVEKCEHVWAEVINVRGDSLTNTCDSLCAAGLHHEADQVMRVHGPNAKDAWEEYARQTFLAHTANIPPDKLRFLQYLTPRSADWWAPKRQCGAVLLGEEAERRRLTFADANLLGELP